jgi:hypothetical protein
MTDEVQSAEVQKVTATAELEEAVKSLIGGGGERKRLWEILNCSMKCVLAGVTYYKTPPSPKEMGNALKALSILTPIEFKARAADLAQKQYELECAKFEYEKSQKGSGGGTEGEKALDLLQQIGALVSKLPKEQVALLEAKLREE